MPGELFKHFKHMIRNEMNENAERFWWLLVDVYAVASRRKDPEMGSWTASRILKDGD